MLKLLERFRFLVEDLLKRDINPSYFNGIVGTIIAAIVILFIILLFSGRQNNSESQQVKEIMSYDQVNSKKELAKQSVNISPKVSYTFRETGKEYDFTGFTEFTYDLTAYAQGLKDNEFPKFNTLPDSVKNELMYEILGLFIESHSKMLDSKKAFKVSRNDKSN